MFKNVCYVIVRQIVCNYKMINTLCFVKLQHLRGYILLIAD